MKKRTNNNRGWAIIILMLVVTLQAQAQNLISLKLENKPLPAALKLIEREGGKNIIFSVTETERYQVSADIRQKSQAEAIGIILQGTPFIYKERNDYFAIQKKDAQAKAIEIRGMVTDERNEPMAYCNVLLLSPDSTFVNGCVTKPDGTFLMMGEEGVPYTLRASYIGYATTTQAIGEKNLLHLLPDSHVMDEVTITANRPLIEPSINGLKANVAETSLAKMGTAGEMLKHLPFVIGSNGDYIVIGHGEPLIYINNRKVRDMEELDRLQADEIVWAEVITIPGAEYAPDVPAVIRIRTIKQRGQGWSGRINLNYTQGHWAQANQQVSLNYRIGGLDIFAKGTVYKNDLYGKTNEIIQINGEDQWNTTVKDTQTAKVRNLSVETGFNYEVNEHHSFGIRYTPKKSLGYNDSQSWGKDITIHNGIEANRSDFKTNIRKKTDNHSVNAYYAGTIGAWTIDFDADYLNNQTIEKQTAEDRSQQDIHSHTDAQSKLYAAKLQVNVPIRTGELSFGTEGTMTERNSIFTQSGYSTDAHDLIKQKSIAAFANYSVTFGKWMASAGVRYEHRGTDYYNDGIRMDKQSSTYNDFIPTASLSWKHKDFNLSLSYQMMTNYPSYALLSNAISYRSQYFTIPATLYWNQAKQKYSAYKQPTNGFMPPYNISVKRTIQPTSQDHIMKKHIQEYCYSEPTTLPLTTDIHSIW